MNTANSSENIDHNRRRFLGTAAMTVASAQLGIFSSANAEPTQPKTTAKEESMTATIAVPDSSTLATVNSAIRPFQKVNVPEAELTELRRRINNTKWPERETVTDTTQGVQLATTQALARYWGTEYDWRTSESGGNASLAGEIAVPRRAGCPSRDGIRMA